MSNYKYNRKLTENHKIINEKTKISLKSINIKLKEEGYQGKFKFDENTIIIDTDYLKEILKKEKKIC